jgi:hypothetical protein
VLHKMLIRLLAVSGIAVVPGVTAQEDANPTVLQHNLAVGAYYSKGDYGQPTDTRIRYFPVSYDYSIGSWNLQLSLPHIEVSGLGNVLINVGGIGPTDPAILDEDLGSQTTKGLGDSVMTLRYQLPSLGENMPFIDLSLELKIPTADETKGLGTGARDYGLQLDMYQQFGQSTVFANAGYKLRGRSNLFPHMLDSAYFSLGISRPANERWSYGLIYDFRAAAASLAGETHDLLPFVTWSPAVNWSIMSYMAKGFTEDSANYALGVQLAYRW